MIRKDFDRGKIIAPRGGPNDPPALTEENKKRHDAVIATHEEICAQGWEEITVINMLPWDLEVNLADAGIVRVPKRKEGMPYERHILEDYRISMADKGGGNFVPTRIMPVQQGKELEREYAQTGGVFFYFGSKKEIPFDEPETKAKFKNAEARMLNFFRLKYREGRDEWNKSHQTRNISNIARHAAQHLAKIGEIDNLPEWLDKTRSEINVCDACGETIKIGAKFCRYCEFPFDNNWIMSNRKDIAKKYNLIKVDDVESDFDAEPKRGPGRPKTKVDEVNP